jgi:LysR family transcriptional regulator, glycine cleavage system transcriptional activator
MSRSLPPLNSLRAFEAAARLGGVGRAASELNVTHGAVSHQIKALEAWLGQPLFRKIGRKVEVNAAGAGLLAVTGEALDAMAERLSKLRRSAGNATLTISAAPSIAYRWMVPRLHRFAADNPGVDVRMNHSTKVTDFKREDVDVAIRYGPGGWGDVEGFRLLEGGAVPLASPALLERYGLAGCPLPLSARQIASLPIQHEAADDSYTDWRQWFDRSGMADFDVEHGVVYDDSGTLLRVGVAGHGVVLGRVALAQEELANGLLVQVSDIPVSEEYGYYLVYDPARRDDLVVARFRDWIIAEAELDQPVLPAKDAL